VIEPIKIDGLAEFSRNLKRLDSDLPKALRIALNEAADIIVGYARPRVPKRSGRAAASIKARSTRTQVRVSGGGTRVPYYPWLDFGGRVGRGRSVSRPFLKQGRYIFAAYEERGKEFAEVLQRALLDVAQQAGIEVD
jgi:hypothetical protein